MATAFRLARVHRLRTVLRQQTQDELARLAGAHADVERGIDGARAAQDRVRAEEETAAARGFPGVDLAALRARERALRAEELRLVGERARLDAELATCRGRLLERRREERQLEQLGARVRLREQAAAEREAALLIDDLARRRR
jgi:flagellar export protein FliJ